MPIAKDMKARFGAWHLTGCCKSDGMPSADPDIYDLVCKITGERINTGDCKDCQYKENFDE